MACVYRHIRLDKNEPFYIGIGKNINRAYSVKNRNKYWRNITNKTNYEIEILFDEITYDEAKEKEKEFIALYGRKDLNSGCLVNMTNGGDGTLGAIISNDTRKKISKKSKGNKYRLGLTTSLRQKKAVSESNKKRVWSKETKEKLSKAFKGKKIWDKKQHPFLNKKLSQEHKNKLLNSNSRIYEKGANNIRAIKINQYDLQGNLIKTWGSSKCIERELNIDCSSIIKNCRNKLKTCKGYIFKYAN